MRQFAYRLLSLRAFWVFGFLATSFARVDSSSATPVFLKIESRFPSGNYQRGLLENKTRKVQFQRWFRTKTSDGVYGWMMESDLVTALRLVGEGVLKEPVPLRDDPEIDAMKAETFPKGKRLRLVEHRGSWIRARDEKTGSQSWILSESLSPALDTRELWAYFGSETDVYVLPGLHARRFDRTAAGSVLEVSAVKTDWIEVRSALGIGYVKAKDAVLAKDLGDNGARPAGLHVPMRSAPLPYADLVRQLPGNTRLSIVSTETIRWGLAKLNDLGEVWWPITPTREEQPSITEKLTTAELFNRKIFDMASSPAISTVKLASANGIYRTRDGQEWSKVPLFGEKNYPIAIAASGAIFVGPYLSEDHGETFQQWIRWDSLVATLKRYQGLTSDSIRLKEIHPLDPSGRKVRVKLGFENAAIVNLISSDQGTSWRPL